MNPKPHEWEVIIEPRNRENSKKVDNFVFLKLNKYIYQSFYLVKQNSQNLQNGQISPHDYVCYVSNETPIVIILGTVTTASNTFKKKKMTFVDFHKKLQEKNYLKFDLVNKIKMYKYKNEMEVFSNINKLQKTRDFVHAQDGFEKSFYLNKAENRKLVTSLISMYKNCFLDTVADLFDFLIQSDKENQKGENIEKFNIIKKEVFDYIELGVKLIRANIKSFFKELVMRGDKFLTVMKEELFRSPENIVFLNANLFPYPKSLFDQKFVKNEKFIDTYFNFFLNNFMKTKNLAKEGTFQKLTEFDKIVSRIESNIQLYAKKQELDIPKQFSLKAIFKTKKDQFLKMSSFFGQEVIRNKLKTFFANNLNTLHKDKDVGDLDLFPSNSTVHIDQLNDIYGLVNPMYINNHSTAAATIEVLTKKKSLLEEE
jgi:hypothetical protein